MAIRSGFFNALRVAGNVDRKYNADDYRENLAAVISNGVKRSADDDLKVTANGLTVSVGVGRGWINGGWFHNDSSYELQTVTPPVGGSRIDNVVLRFDNTLPVRSISLVYVQGTAGSSPTAPELIRTDEIYDLCLARVTVQAGAETVTVTDTRADAELCGWMFSTAGDGSFFVSLDNEFNEWFTLVKNNLASVTLFKRYKYSTTLGSSSSVVTFSIPQYDPDTCFIETYINGMLDPDTYTISGSALYFSTPLNAGAEVTVYCYKSIDGTGIMDVADEITELQNRLTAMEGNAKYIYVCTGTDDNISLSQIAQAIYFGEYDTERVTAAANEFLTGIGGNTRLASLDNNAQIAVEVVGKLGSDTPVAGSGTQISPYVYFVIGSGVTSGRRVIFDFSKTDAINIQCAGSSVKVFSGYGFCIKNATVYAEGSGDIVMLAGNEEAAAYGCRLSVVSDGKATISVNGTLIECKCAAKSTSSDAFVINAENSSYVRIHGGTFTAHTGVSTKQSAVFYINGIANAVITADEINCPTVTVQGYSQFNLASAYSGKVIITTAVSSLQSYGSGVRITNQISR